MADAGILLLYGALRNVGNAAIVIARVPPMLSNGAVALLVCGMSF